MFKKGDKIWSQGLTKETDPRIMKLSLSLKGIKHSEEHKRKISLAMKGKRPQNIPGGWNKGKRKVYSIICEACGKEFEPRHYHYKGRFCSLECRPIWNKGQEYLAIRGEKHWNWKGGITGERRESSGRIEYKNWRRAVFERDNFACQKCKTRGRYLHAHHIEDWKGHPELRYEISNGATLCVPCHRKTFSGGEVVS